MGRELQKSGWSPNYASEGVWFVPDVDNPLGNGKTIPNREDPDPFMVRIFPLTWDELHALQRRARAALPKMKRNSEAALDEKIAELIFEERVGECVKYACPDIKTGETLKPTNGAELYAAVLRTDPAEAVILTQIIDATRDASVLEEGAKKASSSPSGSS